MRLSSNNLRLSFWNEHCIFIDLIIITKHSIYAIIFISLFENAVSK